MFQLEQKIQIVMGPAGKPTGVLVDIETWEQILDALEDAEDIALAREALAALDAAGGDLRKAGYVPWDQARAELEQMDVTEE
jgi:aspartate/tyrosine/aromatic aminotransferase